MSSVEDKSSRVGRPGPAARIRRRFIVASLVDSVGNGIYVPLTMLFVHALTGLSLFAIGAGLTVAGIGALAFTPVAGVLIDRFSGRSVFIGALALRAVGFALYPLALEIRDGVWIDVKGGESALERLVLRYGIGPKALLAFLCVAAGQRLDIEVRLAAAIVAHQFILFPSHLQGRAPGRPFPSLRSARYR